MRKVEQRTKNQKHYTVLYCCKGEYKPPNPPIMAKTPNLLGSTRAGVPPKGTRGKRSSVETMLEKLVKMVEDHCKRTVHNDRTKVYDNKSLMEHLRIGDKYLRKLRDYGYLGYTREGEKYWYTQEDVDKFLKRFHYKDFSTASSLPMDF